MWSHDDHGVTDSAIGRRILAVEDTSTSRRTSGAAARCSSSRATFYTTGMEHSPSSATGTAWELTPWRAIQRTAWNALTSPVQELRVYA